VTVNGPGGGNNGGTLLGASGAALTLSGGLTLQGGSNSSFALGAPNGTSNPLIATSGPANSLVVNGTNTVSFYDAQPGEYDCFPTRGSTTFGNFQLSSASLSIIRA